jgi:hypothetical protein
VLGFERQDVEEAPLAFPGGADEGAQGGEVVRAFPGSKAAGDFCRSFIMRPLRSASLLVKGPAGSCRNRSTAALCC